MRLGILCGLIMGAIGLCGCDNPTPADDENDLFAISLSNNDSSAQRIGTSLAESNAGVFNCRGTSESSDPLDQNAFFPATPNHQLVFLEAIAGVTIRVISDDEFVLWIRGESGSFCNTSLSDSVFRGSWSAGEYEVFIGSSMQDAVIEYTLVVE